MRRNPSRPEAALTRLAFTILLALGLAVVDLTIAPARESAATTLTPIAATAGHGSFTLTPDCHAFAADTGLGAINPYGACASISTQVLPCSDGDCQPVASPSFMSRQTSVITRLSPHVEPGAPRPTIPLARMVSLAMLPPAPAFSADCRFLLDAPWRPARETGADRSVPRPPPL